VPCYADCVCVTRLLLTSECWAGQPAHSLVSENTERSLYRVLRVALPRGSPRSVDRECAGRNAKGVKGSSPERQFFPWWPSHYTEAKATSKGLRVPCRTGAQSGSSSALQRNPFGTTGVLDHGMYTRPAVERERSVASRANDVRPRLRVSGQGVMSESKTILEAEVRCSRSSGEVG
jgi:hypothetical protein